VGEGDLSSRPVAWERFLDWGIKIIVPVQHPQNSVPTEGLTQFLVTESEWSLGMEYAPSGQHLAFFYFVTKIMHFLDIFQLILPKSIQNLFVITCQILKYPRKKWRGQA